MKNFISFEAYQKYALAWLKKDCEKRLSGDKQQKYQSLSEYPENRDFFFLQCVQNDFNTSYMRRWALTIISCIVYGGLVRQNGQIVGCRAYDMTALIQMDEIVRMLADHGVTTPKEMIDRILNL